VLSSLNRPPQPSLREGIPALLRRGINPTNLQLPFSLRPQAALCFLWFLLVPLSAVHPQSRQALSGHYHGASRAVNSFNNSRGCRDNDEFHFHCLEDEDSFARIYTLSRFNGYLPDAGRHRRPYGLAAVRNIRGCGRSFIGGPVREFQLSCC